MATHGQHHFFHDHADSFRDIRRNALHFAGYSIRYTYSEREKRWKVFVRLDRNNYRDLRARMLYLAGRPSHRSAAVL